jgi:hypothetical protein
MRVLKVGGSAIFMYSDDKGLQDFYNNPNFKIYNAEVRPK